MDTEQSVGTPNSESSTHSESPPQIDVESNQRAPQKEAEPVSVRLQKLVDLDQQYFGEKLDPRRLELALNDSMEWENLLHESRLVARANILTVQEMMKNGELQSMQDYDDASLIFQHGDKLDDYKQAFLLSLKAIDLGQLARRSKASQAFDRYMVKSQLEKGIPLRDTVQRFGTQQFPDADKSLFKPNTDGIATPEAIQLFDMSDTGDEPVQPENQTRILEGLRVELDTIGV